MKHLRIVTWDYLGRLEDRKELFPEVALNQTGETPD
jgi:hypothetical protein